MAERKNDLVAYFIVDFLDISPNEAKAIHTLDDFEECFYQIHNEMTRNQEQMSHMSRIVFLWRYYGATMGYKDHFRRFQDTTVFIEREQTRDLTLSYIRNFDRKSGKKL